MTDEPTQNSASAPIPGAWWPCLCGKDAHAQFLSFFHVVGGKHTVTTYFRIHTSRCAKALGDAPVAPIQKASRAKNIGVGSVTFKEGAGEVVREAGAA